MTHSRHCRCGVIFIPLTPNARRCQKCDRRRRRLDNLKLLLGSVAQKVIDLEDARKAASLSTEKPK